MTYWQKYYRKNRKKLREYQREYRKKNRGAFKNYEAKRSNANIQLLVARKASGCSHCGIKDLPNCCYDFHHRNPAEKKFNIGWSISRNHKDFAEELVKCDVLCANCHRIVTHEARYGKAEK